MPLISVCETKMSLHIADVMSKMLCILFQTVKKIASPNGIRGITYYPEMKVCGS